LARFYTSTESDDMLRASNRGAGAVHGTNAPAYRDAMRRLMGENVLMTMPRDPKHLFGILFSRNFQDSIMRCVKSMPIILTARSV
jgi:septum formation inhibitor-activating ATPase MinD